MKICLTRKNELYGFVIVSKDNSKTIFDSFRQSSLVPFVKDGYSYAWQAQKHANLMLKNDFSLFRYAVEDFQKPMALDISAEEMLSNHYMGIYDGIEDKTHGIKHSTEKERDAVFQELKMIRNEIETVMGQIESKREKVNLKRILMLYKQLIRKYFKAEDDKDKKDGDLNSPVVAMPPSPPAGGAPPALASVIEPKSDNMKTIDNEVKKELINFYGESGCKAIASKHSGAHYVLLGDDNDELLIFNEDNDPLIYLGVNDKMQISRISPMKKIRDIYPYHSVEFYQKYWKPIIEEIGHFYIEDVDTVILPSLGSLPDTPKGSGSGSVRGWDSKSKNPKVVEVSFKGDSPCWFINEASVEKTASSSSKYTESDYLNSIVKCTNPILESIYGRTGAVIQVIPNEDIVELDVDFGRGIDVVRLTENDIEIVKV